VLEEFSELAVTALLANKETLSKLAPDTRLQIIRNGIASILGENSGDSVYSEILSPYLDNQYRNRLEYNYKITYLNSAKNVDFSANGTMFHSKEDYHWVDQALEYSRDSATLSPNSHHSVVIALFYDESTLSSWFETSNRDVFFREVLYFNKEELEAARKFTEGDIRRYIAKVLNLTLFVKDQTGAFAKLPDFGVEIDTGGKGFLLVYDVGPHLDRRAGLLHRGAPGQEAYRCRLRFSMPQRVDAKKFVIVFPEPTSRPDVTFTFLAGYQGDLSFSSFLPERNGAKGGPICTKEDNEILIRSSRWVMPRSGVVITWD
jgi:hypothetical protein